MSKVLYTYLEVEAIEREYDEQVPLAVIAEHVNQDFHGGKPVRNVSSIKYVVNKVYHDDEWLNRLEEKWLAGLEEQKGAPEKSS